MENDFYIKIGIIAFFAGIVLFAIILIIIANIRAKRMVKDWRLKNAKLFAVFSTPTAVSPNGFIGIASTFKTVIIHIKDIKGFRIIFCNSEDIKNENDTDMLLFKNIISKVEPNIKIRQKYVRMIFNMKDNTLVKIFILENNSHSHTGRDLDTETELYIPEKRQNIIKEFLSMLENVEKYVKGQCFFMPQVES